MKSCKLRMRVKFNILVRTILLVSCISNLFTSWHCLLKSRSILHGYLLRTYRCGIRIFSAMVWSQGGADYIHCKHFSRAQLLELCYRVLEALLYLLLTRVIWSSHADLSGSGPHKLIALFLIQWRRNRSGRSGYGRYTFLAVN